MLRWFEEHNKISFCITILIAGIIFYLSSLPFTGMGKATSNYSLIYHFFAFFFLAAFLQISSLKGKKNMLIFIIVIFIVTIYGIFDELHQLITPGRTCSISDMSIDTAGILLSSFIYLIIIYFGKK